MVRFEQFYYHIVSIVILGGTVLIKGQIFSSTGEFSLHLKV